MSHHRPRNVVDIAEMFNVRHIERKARQAACQRADEMLLAKQAERTRAEDTLAEQTANWYRNQRGV